MHKRSSHLYVYCMSANTILHHCPCVPSVGIFETTYTRQLLYSRQPTRDIWGHDVLIFRMSAVYVCATLAWATAMHVLPRPKLDYPDHKNFSSLLQLRTGYSQLKDYRHKLEQVESNKCECGDMETTEHFLLECQPSGWDFPVPTEHQWWILFISHKDIESFCDMFTYDS